MLLTISKAEALRSVAWDAYREAEAGLGFAPFRMVGYAARRLVEQRYGIPADSITISHNGDWGHAERTLRKLDPELHDRMKIIRKARGTGYEPHTGRRIAFGTLEVEDYRERWGEPSFRVPSYDAYGTDIYTSGPLHRYGGVLVIEKDGLLPVVRASGLAEEFDLMLATSEGQGVEALKELIEELTLYDPGITIYLAHDFDIAGVQISSSLSGEDSKSWEWSVEPNVIDLGIHFEDIEKWNIADESVQETARGSTEDDWVPTLTRLGLKPEAISYLVAEQWTAPSSRRNRLGRPVVHWRGRRAELNGLIGTLPKYLRSKLEALDPPVEKVVPDAETLAKAYTRSFSVHLLNRGIKKVRKGLDDMPEVDVPENLAEQVEDKLAEDSAQPWDAAVSEIAEDALPEDEEEEE